MKCPFFIRSPPARCISSYFSHCFSISRLYSSWRLISSSAPRTSLASSSDITSACISLAQALQDRVKNGKNRRNLSLLDTQQCTHPVAVDAFTDFYLLTKDMNIQIPWWRFTHASVDFHNLMRFPSAVPIPSLLEGQLQHLYILKCCAFKSPERTVTAKA